MGHSLLVKVLIINNRCVVYSHAYTSTYTHAYTCRMDHNDTITKTSEDLFKKIYLSLYCKGSKRVTQGFTVRGS